MPIYKLISDDNQPIDARLELDGSDIVFHSRGGSRGGGNARNSDYSSGLLTLLKRLKTAGLSLEGAWVDSRPVQGLPLEQRQILGAADKNLAPEMALSILSERMRGVGQNPGTEGGNSTKRIRIKLNGNASQEMLIEALKLAVAARDDRVLDRLPAADLNRVTAENIWHAIEQLLDGTAEHQFDDSVDYDLLVDDRIRLPPKAVFGLAASEALGFEVLPKHFSAGHSQACFRILKKSGFQIVPKANSTSVEAETQEERVWREGRKKTVVHIKSERAPGLSQAKKAQFKRLMGKLFCERCKMDPVEIYGKDVGEACIEVHHSQTHVEDMNDDHRTKLEDLQCLCANCHRIVHRELKIADASA